MPKAKTTVAKDPKEADKPQENLCKCYVSRDVAGKLDGSGNGTGESFWINKLSAKRAEVRNNCLCGLCVGDIIEIVENGPSGWKNEVVRLVERKAELYGLRYTFDGIEKMNRKFPKNIQEFIWKIKSKGCQFEGVVKGVATVSRPNTMTKEAFFNLLNSGPMTFTSMDNQVIPKFGIVCG